MKYIASILVLITIFCFSCSNNPVHLIDQFYSYQSHDDIVKIMGSSDISFTGQESGLSRAEADFNHLSEEGKIGFIFFENKLAAVGFYPRDTLSYQMKISKEFGEIKTNKPIINNGVLIQRGYDYEMGSIGGFFISWSDDSLIKQYKNKIW